MNGYLYMNYRRLWLWIIPNDRTLHSTIAGGLYENLRLNCVRRHVVFILNFPIAVRRQRRQKLLGFLDTY